MLLLQPLGEIDAFRYPAENCSILMRLAEGRERSASSHRRLMKSINTGGRCARSAGRHGDASLPEINDSDLLRNVFQRAFCKKTKKTKTKTGNGNQEGARTGDQIHVSGAVPRSPGCQGGAMADRAIAQEKQSDRVTQLAGWKSRRTGLVWQALVLGRLPRSAVLWCHLLVGRWKASPGSLRY